MEYLRYAFIACYVAYALHKSTSCKIYLLLLPFLIFFREAAFIDPSIIQSYRFNDLDYEIFLLIVVWFVTIPPFRIRRKLFASASDKVLLVSCVLILTDVLLTWESGTSMISAFHLGRHYWYIFLAYLLFIDIFMSFTRREALDFFATLVFMNTILAVFYILDAGLGLNIYGTKRWGYFSVMGTLVTRDFVTYPGLTYFAFNFYLVYYIGGENRQLRALFIIVINFVCTLLMHTIWATSLVVVLPVVAIASYFRRRRRRMATRVVSYTLCYVGMILVLFILVRQFASPRYMYFSNRVQHVLMLRQQGKENTMIKRLRMVGAGYSLLDGIDILVGKGYSGSGVDDAFYEKAKVYRPGDIMWARIIIDMGISGLLVFALFLIIGLKDSYGLWRGQNLFGLVLFLTLLCIVVQTFVSGAFFDHPLLVFIFSIVAIEKGGLWRKENQGLDALKPIRHSSVDSTATI